MTLSKYLKVLISRISHCPLTSSQGNMSRLSSVASSERRATNIFQNTKASVATINMNSMIPLNQTIKVESYICSGVVWNSEGHIVTNYHAIRKACNCDPRYPVYPEVFILTSEGVEERYRGELLGASLVEDLALLKKSKKTFLYFLHGESKVQPASLMSREFHIDCKINDNKSILHLLQ